MNPFEGEPVNRADALLAHLQKEEPNAGEKFFMGVFVGIMITTVFWGLFATLLWLILR